MFNHHKAVMARFGMIFVAIISMISFNIKSRHATFNSSQPVIIVDQSVVRPVLGIEPDLE